MLDFYQDQEEFSLIAPGTYTAKVHEVTTKTEPWLQMSVQYKLENGRRLFQNFSFNEKGAKFISWQMSTLGVLAKAKETKVEGETPTQAMTNMANTIKSHFVGKTVKLDVIHRQYTAKDGRQKTAENVLVTETGNTAPSLDTGDDLPF